MVTHKICSDCRTSLGYGSIMLGPKSWLCPGDGMHTVVRVGDDPPACCLRLFEYAVAAGMENKNDEP